MSDAEPENPVRAARIQIERACRLLESPTPAQLDVCALALTSAIAGLREGSDATDAIEKQRLRTAVVRAASLLQKAGDYQASWQKLLAGMTGGYQAGGAPPAMRFRPRIYAQG